MRNALFVLDFNGIHYVVFCFLSDHKPRARPVRKVRGAIVTLHGAAWLASCQTRCALSNEPRIIPRRRRVDGLCQPQPAAS